MPTIEERLEAIEAFILLSKKGEDLNDLPLTANNLHTLVYNPVTKRIEKIPNKLDSLLQKGAFTGNADDLVEMIEAVDNPATSVNLKEVTGNGNQTDNPIELINDDAYLSVENTMRDKGIKILKDFFNFFSNTFTLKLQFPTLTRNSQQTFQDKTGTIALLEDIKDIAGRAPNDTFKFLQKGIGNTDTDNDEIGDVFCGWDNSGLSRYPEAEWLGGSKSDSNNFKPLITIIIE